MGAGPGLGLPIAKGVIESHGGRVWVESGGEDKTQFPGSQFHVILPLEQSTNAAAQPAGTNGTDPQD